MKPKKEKTILITGGAGFIASSLVLKLQDKYQIICLDHGGKLSQLKKLTNNKVKLVKGEITDEKLLDKLVKDSDIIIHLAGGGGNAACINEPVWAVKTHLEGTYLLLQKAIKYNIKKFIFASSCFVYSADSKKQPLTENAALKPNDFYGNLKRLAEKLIINSGINYSILRFSNVYGISKIFSLPKAGAINNFIRAALAGKEIQIYGSGRQKIDYIHIEDIVRGLMLISAKGRKNVIYNMGSGKLITIEELAKTVSNVFTDKYKRNVKIKKILVAGQRTHTAPAMSINKIKRDLGWQPKVTLRDGIKKIILDNKK